MNEQIDPEQLKQAIQWAGDNSTDPRATELQKRIQSGSLNDSMQKAGYDTSKFGEQPSTPLSVTRETLGNIGSDFVGGIKKAFTAPQEAMQRAGEAGAKGDLLGVGRAALEGSLGTASGALGALFSPLTGAVKTSAHELDKATGGAISHQIAAIGQAHPEILQKVNDIVSKDPQLATDVGDLLNIIGAKFIPGMKGEFTAQDFIQGGKDLPGALREGVSNTVDKIGNIKQTISKGIVGKTEAEILATPNTVKDLANLSKRDREIYKNNQSLVNQNAFDAKNEALKTDKANEEQKLADSFRNNTNMSADDFAKQKNALDKKYQASVDTINSSKNDTISQVEQTHTAAEAKRNLDAITRANTYLEETKNLDKKLGETSVAESTAMKPVVAKLYSKNSQHFDDLFQKEFTPAIRKIPIKQADVIAKLDEEFASEPNLNPKDRLGLDAKGTDITAEDLYNKTRALKVSSAGSKGSGFSTNDMVATRARGVLNETLKEQGADFSGSNAFWQQWKPLQRRLSSVVKPFEPGFQAGSLAKIFEDMASFKGDPENKMFIDRLEQELGTKVGGDTRKVVEQMTATDKQNFASKLAEEEAKVSALASKTESINKIKQASEDKLKSLRDIQDKAEKALKDAKTESTRSATEANIQKTRELNGNYLRAQKSLGDAQKAHDASELSKNIEIERQAGITKKAILKKVLKATLVGGGVFETGKTLITGHL